MATSNEPILFPRRSSVVNGDIISTLLYRLRLSRIGIEKDLHARDVADNLPDHLRANLQDAMFNADRLLLSTQRLAEASGRDDFFTALQDVLANVVGTEGFALFEATPDATDWSVAAHCGASDESMANARQSGAFATALRTGEVIGSEVPVGSHSPVLVIPMLAGNCTVAVLVIFEWLPQNRFRSMHESEQVIHMLHVHGGTILRAFTPRGPQGA